MPDNHTRLKAAGDTLLDFFAFRSQVRACVILAGSGWLMPANAPGKKSLWLRSRGTEFEIHLRGLRHHFRSPWTDDD